MQSLAVAPWTKEEIIAELHRSGRRIGFRYELLDANNESQGDIDGVLGAKISNNALADIKRTAKFRIMDSAPINYLNSRIRPWFRLRMGEEIISSPLSGHHVMMDGTFLLPDQRDDLYKDASPPGGWSMAPNAIGTSDPSPPYSSAWTREDDSQHYFQGFNRPFSAGMKLIVWFMIPSGSTATGVQIQTQKNGAWGPRFHVGDAAYSPTTKIGELPPEGLWHAALIDLGSGGYVDGDSMTGVAFTTVEGTNTALGGPVYFDSAILVTDDIFDQDGLPRTTDLWAEWPLGVYLLATPKRDVGSLTTARDVDAYDQGLVLRDDKIGSRYTIAAGTNVITAVDSILADAGITLRNLVPTDETLPVARDWAPGTSRYKMISDLLGSINYRSLYFSSSGYAVAEPYQNPSDRPIGYTYTTKDESIVVPKAGHELDLYGIPNHWVAVVSEPDRPPLSSEYTNSAVESPTSTVNRGRTITEVLTQQEATSQAALDAKVERSAFEASQVYEAVTFGTALMPHHEDADVIELDYPKVISKAKFIEHTWEMELKAGATMSHRIRRVVSI